MSSTSKRFRIDGLARLAAAVVVLLGARAAGAAPPSCTPCGGLVVDDPFAAAVALGANPALGKGASLFAAYDAPLGAAASPAGANALAATGAIPWQRLIFKTAPPLLEHIADLQAELDVAAELARASGPRSYFELVWSPEGGAAGDPDPAQYGFLVKRASVAITGVDPDARIVTQPLSGASAWLDAFFGEDVAAYLEGIALSSGIGDDALALVVQKINQLDPGLPVAVDAVAWPGDARKILPEAARRSALGVAITLFHAPPALAPADLVPFKVLANEFKGDLSFDPTSAPKGPAAGWSFVRGEDLSYRVIASVAEGANEVELAFADTELQQPFVINLANGEPVALGGSRAAGTPLALKLRKTGPVVVLRIARAEVVESKGNVKEKVTVAGERPIPVEEILRRLQAFEDAQARRLRHYQATNSTTLRFAAASGVQSIEATFEGPVFVRQGEAPDWAWQTFYINGVKWRGKTIPEIPLLQPEKAAAMPLAILFTKEYRYELRGSETIDGRDAWVVGFEPNVAVAPGKSLYRGTVWVDKQIFSRVRSRAVQIGLTGDVISNEETLLYTPIDAAGNAAAWSAESFVLPLRIRAQQLLSVVNTATVVEKEVRLTNVVVNGEEFDAQHEKLLASSATVLRDTDAGLRYLEKDVKTGERHVKEGFTTHKLFALGGLFYDKSLDYPLPLVGLNYFDLDFHGGNRQLNAFWGGVLGIINFADPRFLGSRVDLGVDVFGIGVASTDKVFVGGHEQKGEQVKELPARVTLNFGFPLGSFIKLSSNYRISYAHYAHTTDTSSDFVLPSSHFEHRFLLDLQYARSGYRVEVDGAWHRRSKWEPWGFADNPDFSIDKKTYTTWEAAAAKNWYFHTFQKLGLELDYEDGRNLDRFSKYQFGFFGGNRVHGYSIGQVIAQSAKGGHLSYGFEIGNTLRLDAVGDAVWATDKDQGFTNKFLAGAGIQGTVVGPWETIVNIDIGTPVAGPDHGVVAYIVFLKLFK